jgi:hypothetical protein
MPHRQQFTILRGHCGHSVHTFAVFLYSAQIFVEPWLISSVFWDLSTTSPQQCISAGAMELVHLVVKEFPGMSGFPCVPGFQPWFRT